MVKLALNLFLEFMHVEEKWKWKWKLKLKWGGMQRGEVEAEKAIHIHQPCIYIRQFYIESTLHDISPKCMAIAIIK